MTVRRPEPAAIDYKGRRFLITDRPTDVNMTKYIQVQRQHSCYGSHCGTLLWVLFNICAVINWKIKMVHTQDRSSALASSFFVNEELINNIYREPVVWNSIEDYIGLIYFCDAVVDNGLDFSWSLYWVGMWRS